MTVKRAVGLVVLLVVSACGGSAGTTAPVTTASTATQAPATTASAASTSTQAPAATAAMTTANGSEYLGSYTLVDKEFGTMMTVTVDGSIRTINSNALPDHETGDFPNSGNPNTISEQDVSYDFATEPTYTGAATGVRMTGVAVNGVKFEPGTAENVTCGTGETFRLEALQDIYNLGFDFNNAHVQPTGEYHYHGVSQLLVEAYEHDGDLVHVGFAADGFLMYYSKSGAYGSGYELVMADRTGTDCVLSLPPKDAVNIDGTSPDGTYTSDWVYNEGGGALDSCNGITIGGEYLYVITDDYPYVGRCLNGEVSAGATGPDGGPEAGGPGSGAPTGGRGDGGPGSPPDLTEAAEALGVTVAELQAALGPPPPDIAGAAATFGVDAEVLRELIGRPVEEAPAPSVPVPEDRLGIRGMYRYCEILLFLEGDDGPTAEVWGTQGVNFCPAEVWDAIDPEAVRAKYGAVGIKMNGPRHFVVDLASGAQLPEADRRAYGDLDMQQLATLRLDRLPGFSADGSQLPSAGYLPITVLRTNTWHFYAGSEIYELTDPDGVQYVMQAYSQIVDPDLSEEDLASLGQRLELPEGWSFEARILEEDLDQVADGEAVVIQDELENTYQRR